MQILGIRVAGCKKSYVTSEQLKRTKSHEPSTSHLQSFLIRKWGRAPTKDFLLIVFVKHYGLLRALAYKFGDTNDYTATLILNSVR